MIEYEGTTEQYIRWLEDPSMTIGTSLRLEIAQRLRELWNGQTALPGQRQGDVAEPKPGKAGRKSNGKKE